MHFSSIQLAEYIFYNKIININKGILLRTKIYYYSSNRIPHYIGFNDNYNIFWLNNVFLRYSAS